MLILPRSIQLGTVFLAKHHLRVSGPSAAQAWYRLDRNAPKTPRLIARPRLDQFPPVPPGLPVPTHWVFGTLLFQAGNRMRKEPSTLGKGHFWPEVWRRRLLTSSPLDHAYLLFPLRRQKSTWVPRKSELKTCCPYFPNVKDRARLILRTDNIAMSFFSNSETW